MDFIVIKVNGRDLSKASHEEAVEAFSSAKEPIVVEVVRKASAPIRTAAPTARPNMASPLVTSSESSSSFAWCESSTQTEWTGGWEASPPVGVFPFSQTSLVPAHQVALFSGDVMEHHYETLEEVLDHQDGEEDDEDEDEEDEEGCDLEYEEITLRKNHCDEKLGLTLCYASPDDGQTDIFVSEIEPNSLASRDGRIMEGDQLLQINGVDVHNRRQAVDFFSNKGPEITILVARPHLREDEEDEDDDGRQESAITGGFPNKDLTGHHDVDAVISDAGTMEIFPRCEKDSGVGRTDGSTHNDESTDQEEVPDTPDRKYFVGSIRPYAFANGGGRDNTCHRFPTSLDQKCASTSTTSLVEDDTIPTRDKDSPPLPDDPSNLPRAQSDNSLDREMAMLNQEMQNIQVECESLVSRHIREQWFRCHAGHSYVTYGELTTAQQQRAFPSLGSFNNLSRRRLPDTQPPPPPPPLPPPPPPLPPPLPQVRQHMDKKESVAQWVKSVALDKRHKGVFSKLFSGVEERDSSSAYNTGESSRSTPLTLELAPIPSAERTTDIRGSMMSLVPHPKLVDKSTQLHESDVASVVSCDTCQYCQVLARRDTRMSDSRFTQLDKHQQQSQPLWGVSSLARTSSSGAAGSRKLCFKSSGDGGGREFGERSSERNRNYVTFYPCATMYTNRENLQHTIWLQQQLFRQALAQKHYKKSSTIPTCAPLGRKELYPYNNLSTFPAAPCTMNPPFLPTTVLNQPQATSSRTLVPSSMVPQDNEDSRMEWKVKRRPDGTRYITRRPVRNKILRERAMKIMEERCGLTTDDDAVSELKIGRYWSKEERKRHLEKSRDRKQRKEILLRSKMTSVRERQEEDLGLVRKDTFADCAGSSATNYYKKTGRRKMKIPSAPSSSVMDDFVEPEPSSHSAKGSSSGAKSIGILSVTTV